jgi:ankyrin repeat protein
MSSKSLLDELLKAAHDNNHNNVKQLLPRFTELIESNAVSQNPELIQQLNYRDPAGRTLLHYTALNGYKELLSLLLTIIPQGLQLNYQDGHAQTPLHLCLKQRHKDCAELLLINTVGLNCLNPVVADEFNRLPLHWAAQAGFVDLLPYLIDKSTEADNKSNLSTADIVNHQTNSGDSPLHFAVGDSQLEAALWLLNNGAKVNLKNQRDETPISFAKNLQTSQAAEIINMLNQYANQSSDENLAQITNNNSSNVSLGSLSSKSSNRSTSTSSEPHKKMKIKLKK